MDFNVDSPKQLGEVLFDHLKISAKAKKTKTGQYATGEEVLSYLANEHQIVRDILEWRQMVKLQNWASSGRIRLASSKTIYLN